MVADQRAKDAFLNLQFFCDGRGMHLMPRILCVYDRARGNPFTDQLAQRYLSRKWGINIVDGDPIGVYGVDYHRMPVGVLSCVACHSGKAAGIFVPGLGNKNIDIGKAGRDANLGQRVYRQLMGWPLTHPDYPEVEASALRGTARIGARDLDNMTQGIVPVGQIRSWFYEQACEPMPACSPRSSVKVPPLWGYQEKSKVGQFCDGFADGNIPGWFPTVELVAGQQPETVRKYFPRVEYANRLFWDFLPPPYPFPVDRGRAARGKAVFAKNCQGCHGTYPTDACGLPIYKAPRWIPIETVQTDTDRLAGNDAHFRHLVETSPLCDLIRLTDRGCGYFAPRLVGIWARFPYLHNASVPNVAALLTPPEDRPRVFSLRDAGEACRFDQELLGLTIPQRGSCEESDLERKAECDRRDVYDTWRIGHYSQGHRFGTNLPDEQKRNLIEYLKTL